MSDLKTNLQEILQDKNTNLLPENLKAGITCLGVIGTMEPSIDTSDADATPEDITINKTAYVNGEKVVGTLPLFPNSRTFTVDGGVTNDGENNRIQIRTINSTKQTLDSNLNMEFNGEYGDVANAVGLTPEKLVKGNTILGVEGTASTGLDTSDATATANDIISGKTAYVDGTKITGTLTTNLSNSFNDSNADVLSKLQTAYDNMTPRVLTSDDYKTVCQNLKIIPVKYDGTPLLDTSGLTNMFQAFSKNNNLRFIPLLDTSNVTQMAQMLFMCEELTTIAPLNTSNVVSTVDMFAYCTKLENVPIWDLSKVTQLTSMFSHCPNLTDESLNNILEMLTNATAYKEQGTRMNLYWIGLSSTQAEKCTTLSNWAACKAAGWTTGY